MSLLNLKNMFNPYDEIYEPLRAGVRGGRDQFSWEQVKLDKDRENYLGHSIKAPVGRSQGGPDFMWYTKEKAKQIKPSQNKNAVVSERQKIIELERQAMERALGPSITFISKPSQTPSHPLVMTPSVINEDTKKSSKVSKHPIRDTESKRKRAHSPIRSESKNRRQRKESPTPVYRKTYNDFDEPRKYRVRREDQDYKKYRDEPPKRERRDLESKSSRRK